MIVGCGCFLEERFRKTSFPSWSVQPSDCPAASLNEVSLPCGVWFFQICPLTHGASTANSRPRPIMVRGGPPGPLMVRGGPPAPASPRSSPQPATSLNPQPSSAAPDPEAPAFKLTALALPELRQPAGSVLFQFAVAATEKSIQLNGTETSTSCGDFSSIQFTHSFSLIPVKF